MKLVLLIAVALVAVVFLGGFFVFRLSAFGSVPQGEALDKIKTSPNYKIDEKIFVNRLPDVLKQMRKEAMSFETLRDWLRKDDSRMPAEHLPEVKPDLAEFTKPSDDLKAIWLGHSTFLLNISGKIILVDPVLSGSAAPFSFMVKRFQLPTVSDSARSWFPFVRSSVF